MRKLSDEKLRDLLSDKFANFEIEVDRTMWQRVGGKISAPHKRAGRYSALTLAIGLIFCWVPTPEMSFDEPAPNIAENTDQAVEQKPAAVPQHPRAQAIDVQPVVVNVQKPSWQRAVSVTARVINIPTNTSITTVPTPVYVAPLNITKDRKDIRLNFSAGTFANYKQVSINRYDNSLLSNFNSGDATGFQRLGVNMSATVTYNNFETGLSFTRFRSSINYDEFNSRYDQAVRKELNDVYNIIGLRAGYRFNTLYGKFLTGLELQRVHASGRATRNHNILVGRIAYDLKLYSWGDTDLIIRPVVTSALTTLNLGTMRSRPYTIGVDMIFSRKISSR